MKYFFIALGFAAAIGTVWVLSLNRRDEKSDSQANDDIEFDV